MTMHRWSAFALTFLLVMFAHAESFRPKGTGLLLVRIEGTARNDRALSTEAVVGAFVLRPLFRSPPTRTARETTEAWYIVQPTEKAAGATTGSGWEEAYKFVRESRERKAHPGFDTVRAVYAEPDQEQQWLDLVAKPPSKWPTDSHFAWHLLDSYTQLATARKAAGGSKCENRLVILDTGINPAHISLPRKIDLKQSWNYVENNADVADHGVTGTLKNPGHGTATIALLAGGHIKRPGFDDDIGGAPESTVVPVRISNSVVHFWTRTMAQGIDHAANLARESGKDYCDVVSISMGGVASNAWASAVNNAYDKGVMIVAAAGNNFDDAPTRYTVYPSRFARVTTAVGVTASHKPYRVADNPGASGMQGNYGPMSVSRKSIAAYTPNIAWARLREQDGTPSKDGFDPDGGGTSCAAPQVAAAAALWLATNGSRAKPGWERIESARWALFEAARAPASAYEELLGRGELRAADALKMFPGGPLKPAGKAEVSFPFLRLLLGWDEPGEGIDRIEEGLQRMYEVEAFNLALSSKELSELTVLPKDAARQMSYDKRVSIVKLLLAQPDISASLKNKLLKTSIPK